MLTPERIAEIEKRADAARSTRTGLKEVLCRYEHGGGRMYCEPPSAAGGRDLIADFYDADNREFYAEALPDVEAMLSELRALRAVAEAAKFVRDDAVCGATEQEPWDNSLIGDFAIGHLIAAMAAWEATP